MSRGRTGGLGTGSALALAGGFGGALALGTGSGLAGALGALAWALGPRIRWSAAWTPPAVGAVGLGGALALGWGLPAEAVLLGVLGGLGWIWRASAPGDGRAPLLLAGLAVVVAATQTGSPALGLPLVLVAGALPGALGGPPRLGVQVLLGAVALFAVLPRAAPARPDPPAALTGLSQAVGPGALGGLLDDPTPVLTARFAPEPAGPVYFRGQALDRFDGQRWTRGPLPPLRPIAPPGPQPDSRRVELSQGPAEGGLLLVPGAVDAVEAPDGELVQDPLGGWRLAGQPRPLSWTVWVDPDPRAVPDGGPPGPEDRALPPLPDAVRARFASRVRPGMDAAARMGALADGLRREAVYTREPQPDADALALLPFLDGARGGHCEDFASALAVGGRVVGVPTRVVTGLLAEPPAPGEAWVLRRYHAHAWVEYHDGAGWARADATPAPGAPRGPGAPVLAGEAVGRLWVQAVTSARGLGPWALDAARRPTPWALLGLAGLGLAVGRRARRREAAGTDPVTGLLRQVQAEVRRAGVELPEGLPDVASARAVGDRALGSALEALAWTSYAVRFGGERAEGLRSRAEAEARAVRDALGRR